MRKFIPFAVLILGVVVVAGAFLFLKNRGRGMVDDQQISDADVAPAVSLDKRPVVSLTPSSDGHWLKMEIKKISIDAATLDYELTYKVPDGRTQGVPGTWKLATKDDIAKDMLLGSESSGRFRYDEGVENGNLTLRFRDTNGKLVAKFETNFKLYSNVENLASEDGVFSLTLGRANARAFFVVMGTVGYSGNDKLSDSTKLYGFFTSSSDKYPAVVKMEGASNLKYWDGSSWTSSFDKVGSGIFAGSY